MPKTREAAEPWKDEPDEHDLPVAADYVCLVLPGAATAAVLDRLHGAATVRRKATDLLRSSRLELLPPHDPEVAKYLKQVARGESLAPVLLLRGQPDADVPLIVADGYHRICASYHLTEDADIPCRIADLD